MQLAQMVSGGYSPAFLDVSGVPTGMGAGVRPWERSFTPYMRPPQMYSLAQYLPLGMGNTGLGQMAGIIGGSVLQSYFSNRTYFDANMNASQMYLNNINRTQLNDLSILGHELDRQQVYRYATGLGIMTEPGARAFVNSPVFDMARFTSAMSYMPGGSAGDLYKKMFMGSRFGLTNFQTGKADMPRFNSFMDAYLDEITPRQADGGRGLLDFKKTFGFKMGEVGDLMSEAMYYKPFDFGQSYAQLSREQQVALGRRLYRNMGKTEFAGKFIPPGPLEEDYYDPLKPGTVPEVLRDEAGKILSEFTPARIDDHNTKIRQAELVKEIRGVTELAKMLKEITGETDNLVTTLQQISGGGYGRASNETLKTLVSRLQYTSDMLGIDPKQAIAHMEAGATEAFRMGLPGTSGSFAAQYALGQTRFSDYLPNRGYSSMTSRQVNEYELKAGLGFRNSAMGTFAINFLAWADRNGADKLSGTPELQQLYNDLKAGNGYSLPAAFNNRGALMQQMASITGQDISQIGEIMNSQVLARAQMGTYEPLLDAMGRGAQVQHGLGVTAGRTNRIIQQMLKGQPNAAEQAVYNALIQEGTLRFNGQDIGTFTRGVGDMLGTADIRAKGLITAMESAGPDGSISDDALIKAGFDTNQKRAAARRIIKENISNRPEFIKQLGAIKGLTPDITREATFQIFSTLEPINAGRNLTILDQQERGMMQYSPEMAAKNAQYREKYSDIATSLSDALLRTAHEVADQKNKGLTPGIGGIFLSKIGLVDDPKLAAELNPHVQKVMEAEKQIQEIEASNLPAAEKAAEVEKIRSSVSEHQNFLMTTITAGKYMLNPLLETGFAAFSKYTYENRMKGLSGMARAGAFSPGLTVGEGFASAISTAMINSDGTFDIKSLKLDNVDVVSRLESSNALYAELAEINKKPLDTAALTRRSKILSELEGHRAFIKDAVNDDSSIATGGYKNLLNRVATRRARGYTILDSAKYEAAGVFDIGGARTLIEKIEKSLEATKLTESDRQGLVAFEGEEGANQILEANNKSVDNALIHLRNVLKDPDQKTISQRLQQAVGTAYGVLTTYGNPAEGRLDRLSSVYYIGKASGKKYHPELVESARKYRTGKFKDILGMTDDEIKEVLTNPNASDALKNKYLIGNKPISEQVDMMMSIMSHGGYEYSKDEEALLRGSYEQLLQGREAFSKEGWSQERAAQMLTMEENWKVLSGYLPGTLMGKFDIKGDAAALVSEGYGATPGGGGINFVEAVEKIPETVTKAWGTFTDKLTEIFNKTIEITGELRYDPDDPNKVLLRNTKAKSGSNK